MAPRYTLHRSCRVCFRYHISNNKVKQLRECVRDCVRARLRACVREREISLLRRALHDDRGAAAATGKWLETKWLK